MAIIGYGNRTLLLTIEHLLFPNLWEEDIAVDVVYHVKAVADHHKQGLVDIVAECDLLLQAKQGVYESFDAVDGVHAKGDVDGVVACDVILEHVDSIQKVD